MKTDQVFLIENGNVSTLYSDDLPEDLGQQQTARASNVEPNEKGLWDVVLSDHPRNGKFKGHVVATNIKSRKVAIQMEVDFINEHILGA